MKYAEHKLLCVKQYRIPGLRSKLKTWLGLNGGDGITLLGGDSQNFLRKFLRFFVTLGLKILRL